MDITLAIGILGMLCILAAFALEEFARHTRQESLEYNLLNLLGSALLLWYAWAPRLYPFILLNVIWFAVAAMKTTQILKKRVSSRAAKASDRH